MQNPIDNNKLANLILSNNLATREQIMALWPYINMSRDIGQLLVAQGVLPQIIYQKMVVYLQNAENKQTDSVKTNMSQGTHVQNGQYQNTQGIKRPAEPLQTGRGEKMQSPEIHGTVPGQKVVTNATRVPQNDAPIQNNTQAASASKTEPVVSADNAELRTLQDIFRYARSIDASDVHMSVNNSPVVRRYGMLTKINDSVITAAYMDKEIRNLLNDDQYACFMKTGDLECIVTIENAGRFRVTVMKQRSGADCTVRCIPDRIRTFEETGMPQSCYSLTQWAQGLVLVTGPASCGKSSTLATLVELINGTRPDHIITLESPVEQMFVSKKGQITQREIGRDTMNQESALRAALREDPDIIVVGELRELSTIQLAVSAAETGHLVFGTMNTINASRTIYRLIDSFPPEEQGVIRNMVSESLRGIISQQLIPRQDGSGMVAAYEVLLINSAVANMIRKDEAHQLGTAMITGKASGMHLLDDSLNSLVAQGIISLQDAISHGLTKPQGDKQDTGYGTNR